MFTGLIETVETVQSINNTSAGRSLTLNLGKLAQDSRVGDSICVNGVCLTISRLRAEQAEFDVITESLHVSTLGLLKAGDKVNLERALPTNGRLGGHFVQGHVDGIGTVHQIIRNSAGHSLWIATEKELMDLMIPKGSVAINGVSLTLVDVEPKRFRVYLIPTTLQNSNLSLLQVANKVNLEADLIGKWIKKRLDEVLPQKAKGRLTAEKLRKQGFA